MKSSKQFITSLSEEVVGTYQQQARIRHTRGRQSTAYVLLSETAGAAIGARFAQPEAGGVGKVLSRRHLSRGE